MSVLYHLTWNTRRRVLTRLPPRTQGQPQQETEKFSAPSSARFSFRTELMAPFSITSQSLCINGETCLAGKIWASGLSAFAAGHECLHRMEHTSPSSSFRRDAIFHKIRTTFWAPSSTTLPVRTELSAPSSAKKKKLDMHRVSQVHALSMKQKDSSEFHRASTARPVNSVRHARASTMVSRPPQGIYTDTTAMRLATGIIIRYPSV